MLRRGGGRQKRALGGVRRQKLSFVSLVAGLGLVTSLLEGTGIGLLIPLMSVLLASDPSTALPGPLHSLGPVIGDVDPQRRALLLAAAIFSLVLLKGVVQAANDCLLAS